MLKVKLIRDLRKNVLRGHPWIYQEALQKVTGVNEPTLCEVLDKKGKHLAWGFYSPQATLAVRVLSTESKPPNKAFFDQKMQQALRLRKTLLGPETNCFRLFNGEGDGLPGLVCDIYNDVGVMQFDGLACYDFWDQEWIAQWLLQNTTVKKVSFKPRFTDSQPGQIWGEKGLPELAKVQENGVQFQVDYVNGQKTGFFLDQRDNRQYVRQLSEGMRVLNLFSYTGGFSVYAGLGGAVEVTSVDIADKAIALAQENWELNGLKKESHLGVTEDVFKFVENQEQTWDLVVVDPPSMTHSEQTKQRAIQSYTDLFAKAIQLTKRSGHICFSSCSSHISFNDFFNIITEAFSAARKTGKIGRVSGQGGDHPFPHFCHEMRYLKFVHARVD